MRAGGLNAPSSPMPGVGLGGLVPRTESAVLVGLPFISAVYCDFRKHGQHMRIDDLSAPSGRFVAHVSASVTNVDRCPGRGRASPAADNDSLRSSPHPPRSARAPKNPLLPPRPSPSRLPQRGPTQGTDAVETTGPTASAPCLAWLSDAPDGGAVLGPHLHPDTPACSNSR